MRAGGASLNTRWLAGITGGFTFLAFGFVFLSFASVASGFSLDWGAAIWWGAATAGPALLLLGAGLGGKYRRAGLWTMCAGAALLSPAAFFYGMSALIAPIQSPNPIVLSVAGLFVLLVASCDLFLLKSAINYIRGAVD